MLRALGSHRRVQAGSDMAGFPRKIVVGGTAADGGDEGVGLAGMGRGEEKAAASPRGM